MTTLHSAPATHGHVLRRLSLALLVVASMLAASEWTWPLHGVVSYGLAAIMSSLAVPWAFLLFRLELEGAGPTGTAGSEPRTRSRLFHWSVLALLLAFLTAKWFVLWQAKGDTGEFAGSAQTYTLATYLVFAAGLLGRGMRFVRFAALAAEHPARLMALSFGIAGVLGALILSLPFSVETVRGVSLVDNLFMAFSAVCVTGLAVNNVAETYSLVGQCALCALIQVGGLGIMVLSAAIGVLAGRRIRVKSSVVLAEMVDVRSLASLRRTVVMILVYTLLIEAAGAALLYAEFRKWPDTALRLGAPLAGAADPRWAAVFHAVSAFCNAGFSNVSAGLMPLVGAPAVTMTVTALIVLGGIGFPVLDELGRALFTRLRGRRIPVLSLNTRVALRTTALLLGGMSVVYFVLEWRHSMQDLSLWERVSASVFQSASARTAGFNVVEVGRMAPAVLLLTCVAMFVGANPGGTGGGIKTTTLAVLAAGVRSELAGRPPRLLNRLLPEPVIRRAISVAFLSMTLVTLVFFLLLLLEPHAPLELAFEVVSAFSTTGLSTGVTPELSTAGKLLVILTMFIGRIGPLTLALALAQRSVPNGVSLPEERVMIG